MKEIKGGDKIIVRMRVNLSEGKIKDRVGAIQDSGKIRVRGRVNQH